MGYGDGADFPFRHPDFTFIKFDHVGVHRNGFERIRYGYNVQTPWIYLFDSDALAVPGILPAMERMKTILKDKEIGSLYCTPYHPEVSNADGVGYTDKVPGISMMFNRKTAEHALAMENNFFSGNNNGNRHWDNFLGTTCRCLNLRESFVEHLGNNEGVHYHYRRHLNKNDVAVNINETELRDTMVRYGIGNMVYKF